MAQVYEIPLTPTPQTFTITLSGTSYTLTLVFRDAFEPCWYLTIADVNNNVLVDSLPLRGGCDLLAQYPSLGIPGKLFTWTDGDPMADPTFTNLGVTSHLYYYA